MYAVSVRCLLTYSRPVESHSGARETIIAGPYHNDTTSFRMRRDRDAEGVERDETCGGLSPHHPTRGLGSVVSSRSGVENGFYAYLGSERSHLEHPYQHF